MKNVLRFRFFSHFFLFFLSFFPSPLKTKQVAPEFTLAVFAGSITPMLFEARKALMDKNKKEPFDTAFPVGKS